MSGPRRIPEHATPATWDDCISTGCRVRVDPWDHNTRCAGHRPDPELPAPIVRHRASTIALYRKAS